MVKTPRQPKKAQKTKQLNLIDDWVNIQLPQHTADEICKDPYLPPWCGPYAKLQWDVRAGHWRRSLNPAGQTLVAEHIAKYRHHPWGSGQISQTIQGHKLSWVRVPLKAKLKLGILTLDDIRAASDAGVVKGTIRFDPSGGGYYGSVIWGILKELKSLHEKSDQRKTVIGWTNKDTKDEVFDIECPQELAPEQCERIEQIAQVRRIIEKADLTDDEYGAIDRVYMREMTRSDSATFGGLTLGDHRKILATAMLKIQEVAKIYDWNIPGEQE